MTEENDRNVYATSLLGILSKFELALLDSSYMRERHPIIFHALAHARLVTRNCVSKYSRTTPGASPYSNSNGSLFKAISDSLDAYTLVVQAQDVTGHLTTEALSCCVSIIKLSLQAYNQGVLNSKEMSTLLELALFTALNARFELTDMQTDQLVYYYIIDLLLLSTTQNLGVLFIQYDTICATEITLVALSIDARHSFIIRKYASEALEKMMTHFSRYLHLPYVNNAVLELLHQLCTVAGAPIIPSDLKSPTIDTSSSTGEENSSIAVQVDAEFKEASNPSEHSEFGVGLKPEIPSLAPILPEGLLLSTIKPIPVTDDFSSHSMNDSQQSPIAISWPSANSSSASSTSSVRIQQVASNSAVWAMQLISLFFQSLHQNDSEHVPLENRWYQSSHWQSLIRDRLCLLLIWAGDGVSSEKVGKSSWRSLAGGMSSSSSNGAVNLQLPRLPVFFIVLEIIATLYAFDNLRATLSGVFEIIIMRVLQRALSLPARLVIGISALIGGQAMRVILAILVDAQHQRDAIATSMSESSGVHIEPEALEQMPSHLSTSNLAKRINAALAHRLPNSSVEFDTVSTFISLLQPRGPLFLCAKASLETLSILLSHNFVSHSLIHYDADLSSSDVLRSVVQTVASLSLGQAHVHSIHGIVQVASEGAGAGSVSSVSSFRPLQYPIPYTTRKYAESCLYSLLHSFRSPSITMNSSLYTKDPDVIAAVGLLREQMHQKRLLQSCARTFNAKPIRGVEAMRATGILDSSVSHHAAIAQILHDHSVGAGFHPVAIGEYLGVGMDVDDDSKRRAHVSAFIHDFAGESLVTALRIYLRSFRLPGEAQQIDRILNAFAATAHTACKEGMLLASLDATYLLTFSIIMLNTDLHNPNIKQEKKMTMEAFIKNNEYYGDDICHGRRIPADALERIYKEIRDNPIVPPAVSITSLPLLSPAGDAATMSAENMSAATSLVGLGDPLTLEDWKEIIRKKHRTVGKNVIFDPNSSKDVFIALAAALPEVWHPVTRVALSQFASSFQSSKPSDGVQAVDQSSYNAQSGDECMEMLLLSSNIAYLYNMHSGIDIIVAALGRMALRSLPYIGTSDLKPSLSRKETKNAVNRANEGGPAVAWEEDSPEDLSTLDSADSSPSSSNRANSIHRAKSTFLADFRAQAALEGMLRIVSNPVQAQVLSISSWRWFLSCFFRLARLSLIDSRALYSSFKGSKSSEGSEETVPISVNSSSQKLMQSYASAIVRFSHHSIVKRSISSDSSNIGSSSTEEVPSSAASISAPNISPVKEVNGGIGAIFAWLLGVDSTVSQDQALSEASSSSFIISQSEIDEYPELKTLALEEPDDDESDMDSTPSAALSEVSTTFSLFSSEVKEPESKVNALTLYRELSSQVVTIFEMFPEFPSSSQKSLLNALLVMSGLSLLPIANEGKLSGNPSSEGVRGHRSRSSSLGSHGRESVPSTSLSDDGSTFISTMESARYKCALLPPPSLPSTSSLIARLSLRTLLALVDSVVERGNSVVSLGINKIILQQIMAQESAVTRRARVAFSSVTQCLISQSVSDSTNAELIDFVSKVGSPFQALSLLLMSEALASMRDADILTLLRENHSTLFSILEVLDLCRSWSWMERNGKEFPKYSHVNDDLHILEIVSAVTAKSAVYSLARFFSQLMDNLNENSNASLNQLLSVLRNFVHLDLNTLSITTDDVANIAISTLSSSSVLILSKNSWKQNEADIFLRVLKVISDACVDSRPSIRLFAIDKLVSSLLMFPIEASALPSDLLASTWNELFKEVIFKYLSETMACAYSFPKNLPPQAVDSLIRILEAWSSENEENKKRLFMFTDLFDLEKLSQSSTSSESSVANFLSIFTKSSIKSSVSNKKWTQVSDSSSISDDVSISRSSGSNTVGTSSLEHGRLHAANAELVKVGSVIANEGASEAEQNQAIVAFCPRTVILSCTAAVKLFLHANRIFQANNHNDVRITVWNVIQLYIKVTMSLLRISGTSEMFMESLRECEKNLIV
jgi:Sec7-like guanine-nucleotide exchange factor